MLEGSPCQDASPDETPTLEENVEPTVVLVFAKMNVDCLDDILARVKNAISPICASFALTSQIRHDETQ